MTTVTLRPNQDVSGGASTSGSGSSYWGRLSDNTDSTYVYGLNPGLVVGLGTTVLPAGAIVKQMRVRARAVAQSLPTTTLAFFPTLRKSGVELNPSEWHWIDDSPITEHIGAWFSVSATQAEVDGMDVWLHESLVEL